VGGSGVAGTSSALLGREQTVGIDLSLERRPEGVSSGLGRLARVVGRVESMCTDPTAKGPTGPFGLVHPEGFLVLPLAVAVAMPDRVEAALLRCWVSERSPGSPSRCPVSLRRPGRDAHWAESGGVTRHG
jgi:hypothetical protein